MLEVWRNRSGRAYCVYCGSEIKYGEPCIKIATLYFWHGSRSAYLHLKCIDDTIKRLQELKSRLQAEYVLWNLTK